MLVNFSIQNFGSIKDKQTLSFEADKSKHLEEYYVINTNGLRLLKLGLIFGANASGKTTILKALDFLRTLVLNPKSQKTETFDFDPFLFDENTPNENTVFEIEFIQNDVRYLYEVELNKDAIIREKLDSYNSRKSNVFERTTDFQSKFTKIEFGNKVKIPKSAADALENNTLWNNTVLGGYLKTNMDLKEFVDILNWFSGYLNTMVDPQSNLSKDSIKMLKEGKYKEALLQILKQADFNISNILIKREIVEISSINDFLNNPDRFYKKHQDKEFHMISNKQVFTEDVEFEHTINGNSYTLAFGMESQGTQRYYGFAGILYKLISASTLFSIDELESSLHPDLFQHFLLSFLVNSQKSQLIATTHNREILNDKDIFRNDVIWITDKDNVDSATELYSLADFSTNVIRDTTNISNAYKLGRLGGVPFLGSYYIDFDLDEEN